MATKTMVWIWALSFAIVLVFADKIYAAFKNTFVLLKRALARKGHPYWYEEDEGEED
jgi:hypothetical protein